MAESGPSQAPQSQAPQSQARGPVQAPKRPPWPLATAMKAMEKTLSSQASRLKSLEGRAGAVEKKLSDCEKSAAEFGSRLDSKRAALESVVQEYGQLQRRLENMENLLRNRNFWILRLPPGRRGRVPHICDPRIKG